MELDVEPVRGPDHLCEFSVERVCRWPVGISLGRGGSGIWSRYPPQLLGKSLHRVVETVLHPHQKPPGKQREEPRAPKVGVRRRLHRVSESGQIKMRLEQRARLRV